jgi:hypothetical protein
MIEWPLDYRNMTTKKLKETLIFVESCFYIALERCQQKLDEDECLSKKDEKRVFMPWILIYILNKELELRGELPDYLENDEDK